MPRITEVLRTLYWYDGPICGLVADETGRRWFAVVADNREGWWRSFLVVPAPPHVESGRQALTEATEGFFWDWNDNYAQVAFPIVPSDYVGEAINFDKDDCEICNGRRGGVQGNENLVDGKVVCDYCHADLRSGDNADLLRA